MPLNLVFSCGDVLFFSCCFLDLPLSLVFRNAIMMCFSVDFFWGDGSIYPV